VSHSPRAVTTPVDQSGCALEAGHSAAARPSRRVDWHRANRRRADPAERGRAHRRPWSCRTRARAPERMNGAIPRPLQCGTPWAWRYASPSAAGNRNFQTACVGRPAADSKYTAPGTSTGPLPEGKPTHGSLTSSRLATQSTTRRVCPSSAGSRYAIRLPWRDGRYLARSRISLRHEGL